MMRIPALQTAVRLYELVAINQQKKQKQSEIKILTNRIHVIQSVMKAKAFSRSPGKRLFLLLSSSV